MSQLLLIWPMQVSYKKRGRQFLMRCFQSSDLNKGPDSSSEPGGGEEQVWLRGLRLGEATLCSQCFPHTEEGEIALLSCRSPEDSRSSPRLPAHLHAALWTMLLANRRPPMRRRTVFRLNYGRCSVMFEFSVCLLLKPYRVYVVPLALPTPNIPINILFFYKKWLVLIFVSVTKALTGAV